MAITNHERVGKAMELLKSGLGPFVEREFKSAYKDAPAAEAQALPGRGSPERRSKPIAEWDAAALLKLMWDSWNDVFRKTLGPAERSLVSELRDRATSGRTSRPSPATTPTARSTRPAGC